MQIPLTLMLLTNDVSTSWLSVNSVVGVFTRCRGVCWHSGHCTAYVRTSARVEDGLHWTQATTRHTERAATCCRRALGRTAICMTRLTLLSPSWRRCMG